MPQTTFGQTDALALAVSAWLNVNSSSFAVPVSAQRRFSRLMLLPDIPTSDLPVSVDVFPDSEAMHRESLHTFTSHYAIHLFMQQQVPVGADGEAQCALLAQTHSQMMEGIRTYQFVLSNAVHPLAANQLAFIDSKPGDRGLYNLQRLEEEHVFESDTILIFKAAA